MSPSTLFFCDVKTILLIKSAPKCFFIHFCFSQIALLLSCGGAVTKTIEYPFSNNIIKSFADVVDEVFLEESLELKREYGVFSWDIATKFINFT